VAWFVVTKLRSGSISVATTGDVTNAVAGNITSCCAGVISAFILSYIFPAKWGAAEAEKDINAKIRLNKILYGVLGESPAEGSGEAVDNRTVSDVEKDGGDASPTAEDKSGPQPASNPSPETVVPTGNAIVDFLEASYSKPMDPAEARRATKLAYAFNIVYWAIALILVPFTFFGTEWEFSRAGFTGWCVVSFIWVWFSAIVCIMWPLWESRGTMVSITKGIFRDFRGKKESS
jgi:hypothetical protein